MGETQASITQWAEETFGPCSLSRAADRMIEEMDELMVVNHLHCFSKDYATQLREECADIVITMYRLASLAGFDVHAAVDAKMEVNRRRLWGVKGDGTGYHITGVN